MKTILLIAANPKGTEILRLQNEEREIRERLRLAGYGKVPILSAIAARPKDIQQALLDHDPQIVHFSGHGAGEKGLAFEDEGGNPELIDSGALAELFGLFSESIECVVLNACYSESQAREIVKHIGYVVGMNEAIGDDAAIKFSVGFYSAIGSEKDYEFSYKMGCNAIRLEGIQEYLTPVLLKKTDERYLMKKSGYLMKKNEQIDSDLESKVSEIENMYENAEFHEAYRKFKALCASYPAYRDRAISFLARFSDLNNQIMQGMIRQDDQAILKQQIGNGFLMCLKRFKEENSGYSSGTKIRRNAMKPDEIRRLVRETYPFPVALPHKKTLGLLDDNMEKLKNIFETAEATVQFLALLALAQVRKDLAEGNAPDKDSLKQAIRLNQTSFGTWHKILNDVMKSYHGLKSQLIVPELFDFCFSETPDNKLGTKPVHNKALVPIRNLRNDFHHGRLPDSGIGKSISDGLNWLHFFLDEVRFLPEYKLASVRQAVVKPSADMTITYIHDLNVFNGCLPDTLRWQSEILLPQDAVILLHPETHKYLILSPFVILSDQVKDDIFLMNNVRGKAPVYVSCRFHEELSTTNKKWADAVRYRDMVADFLNQIDLLKTTPDTIEVDDQPMLPDESPLSTAEAAQSLIQHKSPYKIKGASGKRFFIGASILLFIVLGGTLANMFFLQENPVTADSVSGIQKKAVKQQIPLTASAGKDIPPTDKEKIRYPETVLAITVSADNPNGSLWKNRLYNMLRQKHGNLVLKELEPESFQKAFEGDMSRIRNTGYSDLLLGQITAFFAKKSALDQDIISCDFSFTFRMRDITSGSMTNADSYRMVGAGFSESDALDNAMEKLVQKHADDIFALNR